MKACYRMGILILFIVSVFYTDLYSQIPAFTWAQGIGGTSSEISNDITVDFTGNLYITGSFEGTVDFDAGPGVNAITSNGVFDIFILKLDASGNLIWVRSLGGTEDDFGYSISTDATGNCYVTGSFKSMVDFDPGIPVNVQTSAGGDDAFILKLDAAGNMLWVRILGGIGAASGKAIEATSSGYLYITGSFSLTNDFNPGIGTTLISSAGNSDGFICKLNQTGNFEWAGAVGGVNSDVTLAIAVDDFGDVYSTGAFSGTADFDPGAGVANIGSAGYNDVFITKWDASGNYIWAKNIGGLAMIWGAIY
ncbi:MAG: SBBP repeat-containing protein [Bacteroidetes bacterium]|nr:SBBP repeat-containing protein [Bacteroidota bacterium]